MDYVVLDLECNQASDSRDARNRLSAGNCPLGLVKDQMNAVRSGDLCVRPLLLVTVTDFRLDALRARRHLAADPVEILRRQLLRPQIPVASKDYRIGL